MNPTRDLPVLLAITATGLSLGACSGGPIDHSRRALEHSVNAVGYSVVGGAQLVSGTAAIPLGFGGAAGQLSQDLSEALWDAASAPAGAPLPIAEDVVTAGPSPAEAMKTRPEGRR